MINREDKYETMSRSPRNPPPARRVPSGRPEPPRQSNRPPQAGGPPARAAPRRSDPFPIVLGALIGALVIGLMVVVFLISSSTPGGGPQPGTAAGNTATVGTVDT